MWISDTLTFYFSAFCRSADLYHHHHLFYPLESLLFCLLLFDSDEKLLIFSFIGVKIQTHTYHFASSGNYLSLGIKLIRSAVYPHNVLCVIFRANSDYFPEVRPITGHEGPEGKRGIGLLFL